jgi:hypothetical protein
MSAPKLITTKAPASPGPFVCPPEHIHGRTVTCYKTHGCRCKPCKVRVAKDERSRYRAKQNGTYRAMTTPDRAREHINMLHSKGMSQLGLSRVTGLAPATLKDIREGDVATILHSTERAILATKPRVSVRAGGRVDSTGSRRRLQALMVIGYTTIELSAMLGMSRAGASRIMHSTAVTKDNADAVSKLFERLVLIPAPETPDAKRARTWASRNRYVSAFAWDNIDDPNENPVTTLERCRIGHLLVGDNVRSSVARGAKKEIHDVCVACSTLSAANVTGEPFGVKEREELYRKLVPGDDPDVDGVDEAVVQAALRGETVEPTFRERRAIVRLAHAWRWGDTAISQRTGIPTKSIERIRSELGLPSNAEYEADVAA